MAEPQSKIEIKTVIDIFKCNVFVMSQYDVSVLIKKIESYCPEFAI